MLQINNYAKRRFIRKRFKSGEELESFLSQLHKRGIEEMLEEELDVHLGYGKHSKSDNSNVRNDYTTKNIKKFLIIVHHIRNTAFKQFSLDVLAII